MKTPDLTPAQIVAAVAPTTALLHALGVVQLDRGRERALSDAVRFSAALVVSDALMRAGRAVGLGRHLASVGAEDQWPKPFLGDDVGDDIGAIALDDETGEPIGDETAPARPVG